MLEDALEKEDEFLTFISILSGSLVLSVGATIVGISSVKGNLKAVFAGYLFFVIGYLISKEGSHSIKEWKSLTNLISEPELRATNYLNLKDASAVLAGIILCSLGSTDLGLAVNGQNSFNPFLSGFAVFSGYLIAHKGINKVLI